VEYGVKLFYNLCNRNLVEEGKFFERILLSSVGDITKILKRCTRGGHYLINDLVGLRDCITPLFYASPRLRAVARANGAN
jgi:hypothetical protein